jgi:NAD(P)-dependent dehydrogenase (short-subunit alcohol dehydrogenase family)
MAARVASLTVSGFGADAFRLRARFTMRNTGIGIRRPIHERRAASDVDVLVNNAGVFPGGLTDQTTEADCDATFNVNVKAPYFLTASIARRMPTRGCASILNISTMAATIGISGLAAYGASKAAVESLTKAWTAEYAAQGVRVNTVAPGPTRSPASAAMGEMFDVLASNTPAGHGATASTVSFPASEDVSFVYGAILHADGGRVAV